MSLTKKQWLIIGGIGAFLAIGLIVGVTLSVLLGRREPSTESIQSRVHQILEENPLIDGHNDWAWLIRENFRNRLANLDLYNMTKYTVKNDTPSHTDINRLRLGQVGGQFWSIYTDCKHQGKDATLSFLEQIDLMNRIIKKHSDVFQMVQTADEIRQAFDSKRIASLFGVESGQAIESSFAVLRLLYQLGVRYMTLTHNCNTPWADQNRVDRPDWNSTKNNGLTDFGRKVILEMNRLGMLVDLAHVAKKTMLDVLNVTKSPVIFSHSSAYALCNHPRNVQDDVLRLVKENRGIVMVAFTPGFITCNATYNVGNISDVAAHINHIRNVAGIDCVGLGGDYDGVDKTPIGLEDTSKYPKLIEYLMSEQKWTKDEIVKLIGGNILRVLKANEKVAESLKDLPEQEELIPLVDLEKYNMTSCRYLDMYETSNSS